MSFSSSVKGLSWPMVFMFIGMAGLVSAETGKGDQSMAVSDGKEVAIEYTLTLGDDKVLDTNVGSDPLVYTHGQHQIIPGLEKALEGMTKGEQKTVTVAPEEAYGPVNPEAYYEIEKEKIPSDSLKVGSIVEGTDGTGRPLRARVSEIKDDTVILDFNHPLAGKTLQFDVKILDVRPATSQP